MDVIFLDIDGVLNCGETKARIGGIVGIEDSKVRLLKQIVDVTRANIVLVSTWKDDWSWNHDYCTIYGTYLNKKFNRQGLFVCDKTSDSGEDRGTGIHSYIKSHQVNNWVVIDDDIFEDYDQDILNRLVRTNFSDGLSKDHVSNAIDILQGR